MGSDEIIKEIKSKKVAPLYLLHGEEPYFIDALSNFMHDHILDASAQVFNLRVFYGKDSDHKMIVDEASQYPMLGDRRLILLREAQDMKTFAQLESYFENPVQSTTLVICHKYKKVDQRLKLAKLLNKNGVVFESKKLYDNELPGWINREANTKGLKLKPEACQLLADYLGADLGSIISNLDKIKLSIADGVVIGADELEPLVGINKDFNVFEFQKALGARDKVKAYLIAKYFGANPKTNPMPMIMATLYSFYSKLYIAKAGNYKTDDELKNVLQIQYYNIIKEYKESMRLYTVAELEQSLLHLREYDLKSKGVSSRVGESGELLKELVSKLLS